MNLLATSTTSLRWHSLPATWIVVLVILPIVIFGVRYMYRREAGRVGRPLRMLMGGLRILAILLIVFAFFGPYAETIEGEYYKRHLILLVDTSESMAVRDEYAEDDGLAEEIRRAGGLPPGSDLARRERLDLVKAVIGKDRDYLAELAEKFRLHVYTFDSGTAGSFTPRDRELPKAAAGRLAREVDALKATGQVTRIGTALRDLIVQFDAKNEPVAGILLFSDGRNTGGPNPIVEARAAGDRADPIKIFPVAIGNPASAVNISVSRVDAPEVAIAGDEVQFTATVHARGLKGRTVTLEANVIDADGRVLERLPIDAEPFSLPGDDDDPVTVAFRNRFELPGRYRLQIGVRPHAGERVKEDNWQRHVLRVVQLKMKVLFVASKPNFTYRFLGEALGRASETIEPDVLLLSAEPEWPQGVGTFPQEKRKLAEYDVIVLMDVNPADPRISPGGAEQQVKILTMLEEWVKRGGGLVLIAGRDHYIPDAYLDTPFTPLLPVIPYAAMSSQRKGELVETSKRKYYKLTPEGAAHPIMRILEDVSQVHAFWEGGEYRTEYDWYEPVERAKSSATPLATRRDLGDPGAPDHPLIVLQAYGLGKTLWLGTDEMWRMRWGVENLYYWRFWSGVIRHLATYRLLGGNKRIKIWVDRDDGRYQVGDSVGIEAKFLDENFEPVEAEDGGTRTIKLRPPAGEEIDVVLNAGSNNEGIFRTRITAGKPGIYSLIATPDTGDEEPAEATFIVEETTVEKQNKLMDMRTLKGIAKASQGEVLRPGEFHQLLEHSRVPVAGITRSGHPHRSDLWDRAWVLWLFVGLLAAEWILRRLSLLL